MRLAVSCRVLFALLLGIATIPGPVNKTAASAEGGTILTVAGSVGNPNRGAVDPFVDALMKSQDLTFDRAHAFDRDALVGLGLNRIVTKYPGSDRTIEVEGPLLRDVLAKAGATGSAVKVIALDGYAVDLPMSDLERWPVVLALKSGGEWLGIGGRGPCWVVYPRNDYPDLAERDDANWVWGVFFVGVH